MSTTHRHVQANVLVAEPEPIFMRGLIHVFEERSAADLHIVAQAENGAHTIELVRSLRPDVALLPLRMPDMTGLEILAQIRDLPVRAIMLTSEDSQDMIYRAIQAGARSYRLKFGSDADLIDTIRRVAKGEYVLDAFCLAGYIEASKRHALHNNGRPLPISERELEVLTLLHRGLTQPQIAEQLSLSLTTVKTHCRNSYRKLGVSNAMGAVGEALRLGLLK